MKKKISAKVYVALLSCMLLSGCLGSDGSSKDELVEAPNPGELGAKTIVNPVAPNGHDPWVIQENGTYYYLYSHNGSIWLNQNDQLQDVVQFTGQKIWTPPKGTDYSEEIWAPEIFFIDGHWYVYFAADDGANRNHRMFVLKSMNSNAFSEYEFIGKVSDSSDKWAIDGTVLKHEEDMYFIWSGWDGDEDVQQNLYIAEMNSPTSISSNRTLISEPEFSWEKVGNPFVNEGPQVLKNQSGIIYIIYSASGSWTDSYALGQLQLIGVDPLNSNAWEKSPEPVFASTEKVFSPGHASFTKSPNGSEDWIIYHSAKFKGAGWDRDVNMKKFTWDIDGKPDFGKPTEKGVPVPAPSD